MGAKVDYTKQIDTTKTLFAVVHEFQDEVADAGTVAIDITCQETMIKIDEMAQAITALDLTIDPRVVAGAKIFLKLPSDATGRDVTLGTGTDTSVISGVSSKIKWATLIYDGTIFNLVSAYQIE